MDDKKQEGRKKVLYIENDGELVESFKPILEGKSITVSIARHMEEAKQYIRKEVFDGYIIDTMLPQDKDGLEELERKEKERMDILDELISKTKFSNGLTDDIIQLRMQIDAFDEEIEELLNLKGGLELVKEIAKKHFPKKEKPKLDVPVIFFAARAAPELVRECREYVKDEFFRWYEKPSDEETVAEDLSILLKAGISDLHHG